VIVAAIITMYIVLGVLVRELIRSTRSRSLDAASRSVARSSALLVSGKTSDHRDSSASFC